MHARIMYDTGGACPCASRFVRPDVHGVGACVGFLFASHYRSIVRGDRAMCSVSTKEAAQVVAAPARVRCVPPKCGGARLRVRLLLWLSGWFRFAAVVLSWRCRSMNGVCIRADPPALLPHACGGGCRRRAYFVVICSPFSPFYSAYLLHHLRKLSPRGSCGCILIIARALS